MNTKSMVLILNSLLLFNTVSHGFSMSSWRKKVVETCTKIGKKSIAVVCGMALALLNVLHVKAGKTFEYLKEEALRKTGMDFPNVPPMLRSSRRHDRGQANPPQTPPVRPTNPPVPVDPQQSKEVIKLPRIPGPSPFAIAAASAGYSGARIINQVQTPSFDDVPFDDVPFDELDKSIEKIKHRREFKGVLDDIRNKRYRLSYLPPQLSGTGGDRNMLEHVPKVIVQQILEYIFCGNFYHEQSFYVPIHHSDPKLLEGIQTQKLDFKSKVSLKFIDGDPRRLKIALRSPAHWAYPHKTGLVSDNIITIDTSSLLKTIKTSNNDDLFLGMVISNDSFYGRLKQTYYDHYCGALLDEESLFQPDSDSNSGELIPVPPLIRQRDSLYRSRGIRGGSLLGGKIQRNLSGGRVISFMLNNGNLDGNLVGIYEKVQDWYDEYAALKHPKFKSVVTEETSGETFHLVQVIKEDSPVLVVGIPYTPVYIKDKSGNEISEHQLYRRKDGNEISEDLRCSIEETTLHLRPEREYPKRIDALALGFNPAHTNKRLSLYKQLGDNLSEYHPILLLHQKDPITPHRKAMLYPDDPDFGSRPPTLFAQIQLVRNRAQLERAMITRAIKSKVSGKEFPPLE